MPDSLDLSIVVVNWNQFDLTAACLTALNRSDWGGFSHETILVDNGSAPETVSRLRELAKSQSARLIENSSNLGFARANNIGLKSAQGRYWLLLNNDTEVKPGAIHALLDHLDTHPQTGIAGAQLLNSDGSVQRSYDMFPIKPWRMPYERVLDRLQPENRHTHRGRLNRARQSSAASIEVDWVLGAALMIRRSVVQAIGLLDERYFMYAEDIDWCYRARQANWQVGCLPAAQMYHYNGGSARHSPELRQRLNLERQKSLELFYNKFYGPVAARLLRLIHARQRTAGQPAT